ncbi:MAG: Zn-ribbon domain-containing OB-fold protein [Candidatus Hadarchaeales archaeon]
MAVPRFWREIPSRYNLIGTRCTNCGKVFFPPRYLCSSCGRKGSLQPYKVKGRGRIVSFTKVHVPAPGFEKQAPYFLALIELEEGCRVLAQLTDVSGEVKIGDEVEMVFRKISEEGEIICYGYKARPLKSS